MTSADPMTTPKDAQLAIDEIRLIGGDELVREMTGTFARFASTQVERLREGLDAGDLEIVAILARALHTSARQMGAGRLAEAALSAEVAAMGRDASATEQAVTRTASALSDARAWLDALAGG